MITDWITAIAASVGALAACGGALSVFYAAKQAILLKAQIREDHERTRRQTAVDLVSCLL